MKNDKHETKYDFSNACPICREPVICVWKGFGLGYSIGNIEHKKGCEFKIKEKQISNEIFKSIPKKWLKF